MMEQKTLSQIADEHYAWIESVDWEGNRADLENLVELAERKK